MKNPQTKREIIFIGLGRMGSAMVARLHEQGFIVHAFDKKAEARAAFADMPNVTTYDTLKAAVQASASQKVVWLMIPSRFVEQTIDRLQPLLNPGDTIIDGGNSFFKDSLNRHHDLNDKGINFIDVGVSGGVEGARNGASLMVGGEGSDVHAHADIFTALATKDGYGFVGGPGAGHFTKMIHNGIEYGMMGALAEGVNILEEHADGLEINIPEALKAYENGSIISSSLTSWLADVYENPQTLRSIAGSVPRGETEMEMEYVIGHNRARVLSAALTQRKLTRTEPSFIGTLISALRHQFGGHAVNQKKSDSGAGKRIEIE